ncbi:hypothetical protein [Ruegeria atlantica]|uniref:Malonyl-CoA decarboxylase C-terminal domain-containing protein n=1 Tax=Ruegeria atlantica TaxID=81569 RepID=A0ABX1WAG8_9RHOB|nr:hypothetical protein [Ruegeria atlantica]NOD30279.1 hypothetical protein [Ruegeria atlantica]
MKHTPLDPIAQFHLGNSAFVHSVQGNAIPAPSVGTLVNYLYEMTRVAQHHNQFATTHEMIAPFEINFLAASTSLFISQER